MIRAAKRMLVLAAVGLFVGLGVSGVVAQAGNPCGRAGQGDRDHDGLSNCLEKRVYGTSHRDYDTDDDGVPDPDELEDGTDPTKPDTDGDGMGDGKEGDRGCDPTDADSDKDGLPDGEDCDPRDELESAIKGNASAIVCPAGDAAGSLTVLGITVVLTAETEFEDVESCAALEEKLAAHGGAHVKVKLSGEAPELVARKVELEDSDHDGCPNGVGEDADNDDEPDDEEGDGGDGGDEGDGGEDHGADGDDGDAGGDGGNADEGGEGGGIE
jgi:hypothetical protein